MPITAAGTPATLLSGGTSFRTSEPAPTTLPRPFVTPLRMMQPHPIHTPSSTTIPPDCPGAAGPLADLVVEVDEAAMVSDHHIVTDRDRRGEVEVTIAIDEDAIADPPRKSTHPP
ncbi:MAG: hypothetical protein PGN12_12475 [Sphingomonas phyllosphaerae]